MTRGKTVHARISRLDPGAKQALLGRASRVLRRQGFAATTMRELASALGVGPSTFYYHFKDKDDLLLQACEQEIARLAERVERAGRPVGHENALERLERVLREIGAFQLDWQAMVEGPLGRVRSLNYLVGALPLPLRSRLIPHERSILDTVRGLLKDGRRDGSMDVPDLTLTAFTVLAPGEQLIIWYRPGGALSRTRAIELVVALALRIVRSSGRPARTARR